MSLRNEINQRHRNLITGGEVQHGNPKAHPKTGRHRSQWLSQVEFVFHVLRIATPPPLGMRVKLSQISPCFREIPALFPFVVATISGQRLFKGVGLLVATCQRVRHSQQVG